MAELPQTQPVEGEAVVASRTGALMGMVRQLRENAAASMAQAKPWTEVFDRNNLSKPANVGEVSSRLRKNVAYFRTNYAVVSVGTTAMVMVMNPWSLIVLAALALVWFYFYMVKTTPLVINGRELSDREKFMLLSASSLITVFFLTSVGATLFYALGLSMLLIGLHGTFHQPDDLFLDEVPADPQGGGGFLSLLAGAMAPKPPVATAV